MKLAEFAAWAIQEGPFDGGSIDGWDLQEKAIELGLLKQVPFDPKIHGDSDCCEPGDEWYVFSDELKAALVPLTASDLEC